MPLYDYICAACGRRFEVIHGVNDPAPEACPLCGSGPIRKAFAPPTIVFKGSGWAKKERRSSSGAGGKKATEDTGTDSAGGEKSATGSSGDKTSSGDAGSPSGPAPTKSSPSSSTSD